MATTVTDQIRGITITESLKAPCKAVATSNITLSGEQTVNSVACVEGNRVLVTAQTSAVDNGIYDVSTGTWQRAKDFDGNADVVYGTRVIVALAGNQYTDYEVTTADPIVIGTSLITFQHRYGANATYDITTAEIDDLVTPTDYAYPPGHVYRYGTNTTPGTTDMTSAFQAAWKLTNPYAPGDSMKITGTIPIIDNQNVTFDGTRITFTGTTLTVFDATDVDDWSITGRLYVTGDSADGQTVGTAVGLYIENCARYYVGPSVFQNIKGHGIKIEPGASAVSREDRGTLDHVHCLRNYVGAEIVGGTGSEYLTWTACNINKNRTNLIEGAGNVTHVGGNIGEAWVDGIVLKATDGNHAHGIFSAVNINHNGTGNAIRSESVTNGQTFVGCHVYYGTILFETSEGVIFDSCTIDVGGISDNGSTGCGFRNCKWPMDNSNAMTNNASGGASYTIWENNRLLDGTLLGDGLGGIRGVKVSLSMVGGGGITITPANLSAGQVLIPDTYVYTSARNSAQQLYTPYNDTNGRITSQGLGDGRPYVSAQFRTTTNAADDANMDSVFAQVRVNGALVRWMTRIRISTVKNIFSFEGELMLNEGDYIDFRMLATATLANDLLVATSETSVIVEGL